MTVKATLRRIERHDGFEVWAGAGLLLAVEPGADPRREPRPRLLASALRRLERDGARYVGWVVTAGESSLTTDPLPDRPTALAELRASAADTAVQ